MELARNELALVEVPPISGRAHARTYPVITAFRRQPHRNLFRQPRPGRRLREKDDAVIKQSLLDAGIIGGAGGPPVVLVLPEADCAFIDAQCSPEASLGQPCQNAGGAELAACDEGFAVSGHDNLHSFGDASHAAAKVAVKKRIKRIADGSIVLSAVGT